MRRTALLLSILLVVSSGAAFAADRHLILQPTRPLTEADRATLSERGITIQKVLTGNRYLVVVESSQRGPRIASDAEVQSFGTLEPIRPEWKIDRSVAREVARTMATARLRVLFHEDVTFDDARSAVAAAGGAVRDPLQVSFGVMNSLEIDVPTEGVQPLANDDRVLAMAASHRFPIESHNENAAGVTKVNLVQAAPYDLTGEGVTLSIFELAKPEASHVEFQGRLTANGSTDGGAGDKAHATHVSGTIMAAGLGLGSKGMSPKAKLQTFVTGSKASEWLDAKQKLPLVSSQVDNNSWGYVLGWKRDDSGNAVWNGYDAYYGAYDLFYTAPIDQITREKNVLFVHSSGNDASGLSLGSWGNHKHVDSKGEAVLGDTYCFSKDGSGNDCPTLSGCTAGRSFCETSKHMADLPFRTVGVTASGKNTIAVGNVLLDKSIYPSSSRGPARDGRVKPDLVAPGASIWSTVPGNGYDNKTGTSMAAPMVTGTSGLLIEQWRRSFGGANPLPAEIKALFIAGAEDLGNSGPDYTYGYGLIDAKASIDLIRADGGSGKHIRRAKIATGNAYEMTLTQATAGNLRVVLQWTDPEIISLGGAEVAERALVNDLDMKVIGPGGTETLPFVLNKDNFTAPATRGVNSIDNTEVIEIANAVAGTYRVVVTGKSITDKSPQEFVVVTTAAAAPPCFDPQEKGDTSQSAYGLAKGDAVTGALCSATDVDYYSFTATNGRIAITITTGATAIRATLLVPEGGATPTGIPLEVAANSTATLTHDWLTGIVAPPPNATILLKIEPIGAIEATSTYTIVPSFEVTIPAKRRSVRR